MTRSPTGRDMAVFQAFKEVEVAVREGGGFDPSDVGVALMRKAFEKTTVPLRGLTVPEAERDSTAHLFAGAVGLFIYHEKNPVSEDVHLTLLDGMLGQVLATRAFQQQVQERVTAREEEFAELRPHEVRDALQDLVLSLEVETEMEWDPIARVAAQVSMELFEGRISSSHGTRYLDPPGIPDVPLRDDPGFADAFRARSAALNRATWVGCRFTYHTRFGDVSQDTWVRNSAHAGISPLGLAENIAQLLAGRRALKLAQARRG